MMRKVLEEGLLNYLSDNTQSWMLCNDGSYKQNTPGNNKARTAQTILIEQYSS